MTNGAMYRAGAKPRELAGEIAAGWNGAGIIQVALETAFVWGGLVERSSNTMVAYCVSSPTSMCSSRDSSTAATKARSSPVSHAAIARERREKITTP